MKNFEKKEKDLSKLIDRLSNLRTSYSQINDNDDLKAERDTLRTEKKEIEKKNQDLLREHKYLSDKITKLQKELEEKKNFEKKFNRDINDLNQETQSLVEEIEKWQM
tara:strand:+ start:496 stop:816 length:321 start_codon:yes stop_codon:yes gene_type:complete